MQEAEMEQVKAQEVVLKDAIEDDKDKTSEALVRAGETPPPSPTAMEIHGPRKVIKTIKAPILLCVSHPTLIAR
jgi:hypothetical protein